ncbi:UNVERIFIED_CONTAM: hypothetical protein K2H54_020366 [Gekko kuhli]
MSWVEEEGEEAGASLRPCLAKGDQEAGSSPHLGRRVQFLLPPVTIRGPPPQEEEKAFYRHVKYLLGATKGGFEWLFAADGWEDLLEEKSVRKLLVRGSRREGRRPQPGQEVAVNLLGLLEDGSLVERDPQLTFVPGQGDVPQALELGVLAMRLGEVALILTRPAYAYGHVGRKPDVPKEAPLLYEVTLLRARDGPDLALLPAAERLSLGNQKRERGNFHYEREDYQPALCSYRQALCILASPGTRGLPEEEEEGEEALQQLRVKCLNNCAAAQLKLRLLEEALVSCDEAMRLDPDNAKALYWKGKLLAEQGEDQAAMEMLKRALQLEPATKAVHAELSRMAGRQRGQLGGLLGH